MRLLLIFLRPKTPSEPSAHAFRQFAFFFAGLAPALLLIAYFKHSIAPPGDLFTDASAALHKLRDPSRYWALLKWYAKQLFRFGHWLLIPGTLALLGLHLFAGPDRARASNPGFRSSMLTLALTLAGYFAVYLITPYDIYWHLRFSLARLFLQIWPSALFLLFLTRFEAFSHKRTDH